ncbi:MAG: cephalosporin hydroxylase family protein [Candidatus Moduliflexus flocculans]|nr:cephalosporin hydroxylase family protein [Candidatus Moduliflexus flocculans]
MIQQIIAELKPDFLIETGTLKGGSSLYYASVAPGPERPDQDRHGRYRRPARQGPGVSGLPGSRHPRHRGLRRPGHDPADLRTSSRASRPSSCSIPTIARTMSSGSWGSTRSSSPSGAT